MPKAKNKLDANYPLSPVNREITLADYKPHPRNYNKHPAQQVERIAGSLQMFGQVRSVVVWRDYFLAGHGVREAALALGWATLRADVLPDDYPEELALAYVAADNELSRLSDPDQAQLAELLSEAKAYDERLLAAIGYDDREFEQLLQQVGGLGAGGAGGDAEPQIDKAEELRAKWGVQPGQLWALGEHRLICGDCTDPAVVARVMGGEKAQLLLTSPPYGVGMEYENGSGFDATCSVASGGLLTGAKHIKDNGFAFVNFGDRWTFPRMMGQVYLEIFQSIEWRWYDFRQWKRSNVSMAIWNTTQPHAMSDMESLFTFQNGNKAYPVHDLSISKESLWIADGSSAGMGHPAVMAVGIAENAIKIYTIANDIVYEPFSGSGTTLIACQNLSRRCRAVEISPAYVAVALQRFVDAFQIEPRLLDG